MGCYPDLYNHLLGRGTVVRMRKRKFQLVLFGCLLVLLACWIIPTAGRGTGDERRFRKMLHAADWGWRFRFAEKRLPSPLARLLHVADLKTRCMGKAEAQLEALLASGYLTNTSITITNMPSTATSEKASLAELQRRLKVGAHLDFLSFYVQTNDVVVTCRARDLVVVRTALENP
jgi:hypothetical protein